MTVPRIAVIGVGRLGFRHLEAVVGMPRGASIAVVDPAADARERARMLAEGVPGVAIICHESIADLVFRPDVAIVATNSRERRAAVDGLLARGARKLLLEKVLFTREADYDDVATSLAAHGAAAWVNCALRTYSSFPRLQEIIGRRTFAYTVEGTNWGLGCNTIHHLDEFAALAGTRDLVVDGAGLAPGVVPAKRPGYIEFFGTLRATAPDGSTFTAICRDGPPGARTVTVVTEDTTAVISQGAGTMTISREDDRRTLPVDAPLQSRITGEHVTALLEDRAPRLPDYATAAALHRPMIAAFLDHLRRTGDDPDLTECPIT